MLITLYKSNRRTINIFSLMLIATLWFCAFYTTSRHLSGVDFFINKWIDFLLVVIVLTSQAVWINDITNKYKLLGNRSYLVSLIFIIFSAIIFNYISFSKLHIANYFIIGAFQLCLKIYNVEKLSPTHFNVGLLIGIASIIYHPYVIFLVFGFFILFYFSNPSWRDFIVLIIGFAVPLLYILAFYFLKDNLYLLKWKINTVSSFDLTATSLSLKTLFLFITLLILLSFYCFIGVITQSVIRIRKQLWMIIILFLLLSSSYFINGHNFELMLISLSIPSSIIIALFFEKVKKIWLAQLIFSLLLLNIVWSYFS